MNARLALSIGATVNADSFVQSSHSIFYGSNFGGIPVAPNLYACFYEVRSFIDVFYTVTVWVL